MSRDLKKMVQSGWVSMRAGADPRSRELRLTRKGYLLVEEVTPVWSELHHKVESTLGQFNLNQIDLITEAIRSNLSEFRQ